MLNTPVPVQSSALPGGVAEAAVRTAYEFVTGEPLSDLDIKGMRGVDKNHRCKDVELDIKGTKVKVRVVSTLKEAEKSLQEIKNGTADFHMLEVRRVPVDVSTEACQPLIFNDSKIKERRAQGLYKEDSELTYRRPMTTLISKSFTKNTLKTQARTKRTSFCTQLIRTSLKALTKTL